MSVSSNLLCSFELLKPLDSTALKSHIKKGRNQRNSAINSPVSSETSNRMQAFTNVLYSLLNLRRRAFEPIDMTFRAYSCTCLCHSTTAGRIGGNLYWREMNNY